MRLRALRLAARAPLALVALALLGCASAQAQTGARQQRAATAARPDATVIVCGGAGDVVVRGTDAAEVRATVAAPAAVRLRPTRSGADESAPASSVEVTAADDGQDFSCYYTSGLTVEVPRGSFVQIKTVEGRVTVAGVAGARVETVSGDVEAKSVGRSVEVVSANGSIVVGRAAGRVRLHTISGTIDAAEVSAVEAGDEFSAKTTSGSISLARVTHPRVEAQTTSGEVSFRGALAESGVYNLRSHSGGVRLVLPPDSSFQLNAKVSHSGEIVTDFPIRVARGPAGENLVGGSHTTLRLSGVAGAGERPSASVTLTSFSGALTLRKNTGGER